ncbi:MAG: hypothetical protein D3905_07825 [Candidatus Electrothrix sp. AS4_5]|nr:hypothetical protein [Candidatus Electrothrix gigas]
MKYLVTGCMAILMNTLLSPNIGYTELLDKVSVHGFGSWLYGQTNNDNEHTLGKWDSDGNAHYVDFSLNVRAEISDNLTAYIQPAFEEIGGDREVGVDYAFAEWYVNDLLTFRAGKIKAPLMLFNEIHDVGTVRPFFLLPVGVYSHFTAESYQGLGITGVYSPDFESDWQLSYDIFGGLTDLSEKTTKSRGDAPHTSRDTVDEMLGVRFFIQPPIDGLRFGVSTYMGKQEYSTTYRGNNQESPRGDTYVVGGSIEYLADQWEFRGEYLQKKDTPNDSSSTTKRDTFYLEAAYRFTEHWQVASRYEVLNHSDDSSSFPDSFQESKEFTLGLNYWIRPNLVVKCAAVFIQGNKNVQPMNKINKIEYMFIEDALEEGMEWDEALSKRDEALRNIDLEQETVLGLIGVQFSF